MHIEGIDEIDNKIVNILMKDARMSYSDIAEEVGLSRVAVKNRMDQLEKNGIIRGYTAVVDATSFPEGRRFFVKVITYPEYFNEAVDTFGKYDIIRRIYAITGQSTFIAEGYALSNMRYNAFMKMLNRHMDGIERIFVDDVMFTIKDIDGGVDYVRLDERNEEGKED